MTALANIQSQKTETQLKLAKLNADIARRQYKIQRLRAKLNKNYAEQETLRENASYLERIEYKLILERLPTQTRKRSSQKPKRSALLINDTQKASLMDLI